jgi:hypothetical protein
VEANTFEILSTLDKHKRDQLFSEYRASDDPQERQAVKFSSSHTGFCTWSVGYPAKVDINPTKRRARKLRQEARERAENGRTNNN